MNRVRHVGFAVNRASRTQRRTFAAISATCSTSRGGVALSALEIDRRFDAPQSQCVASRRFSVPGHWRIRSFDVARWWADASARRRGFGWGCQLRHAEPTLNTASGACDNVETGRVGRGRQPSRYPAVPRSRFPDIIGIPRNRSPEPPHRARGLHHYTRPDIAPANESIPSSSPSAPPSITVSTLAVSTRRLRARQMVGGLSSGATWRRMSSLPTPPCSVRVTRPPSTPIVVDATPAAYTSRADGRTPWAVRGRRSIGRGSA